MGSSMKQERSFMPCAALSAFLVMTVAASAAQVKAGALPVRREFLKKLVEAAVERAQYLVRYDPE